MIADFTQYQRNIRILASSYDLDKNIDTSSDEFMECVIKKLEYSKGSYSALVCLDWDLLYSEIKSYMQEYSNDLKTNIAVSFCEKLKQKAIEMTSPEIINEIKECYKNEYLGVDDSTAISENVPHAG